MAIGGSGKVVISSRNSLMRKRLHKQLAARRMLVESLEGRQLMAVGPQLLGVQPNEGALLVDGQVRHTSPNELVFRFDDRVGLDAATLDGIRIIRSGEDGAFERASMASDLGSGGLVLVEFYANEAGQVGNGIQIKFTQVSRNDTRAPVVRLTGRTVEVEVNSNPSLETRVDDLLRAFDLTQPTAVTNLVYGLRLRGSTTLPIGRTVNTTAPIVLGGANSAKVSTDFGAGASLQVRLSAKESGAAGVGLQVNVTSRDRGGPAAPTVTVNGKVISVELNSNLRFASTVSDFVSAINGDAAANKLIEANQVSGTGATRLGTLPTTYSPLVLGGVSDIEILPAYVGLGDTSREVILRFAQPLPDDSYRIEILGRGDRALLNANGEAFNGGLDKALSFELQLGAKIESIVPQPVERNANGQLVQATNRIDVYFNNDDLINPATIRSVNGLNIDQLRAQRPVLFFQSSDVIINQSGALVVPDVLKVDFYQLSHLAGTLSNTDDTRIPVTAIRYFPDADRVQLTFARPLDDLVHPVTNAPLVRGELRLRIGTNESRPLPPVRFAPVGDAADTFSAASSLEAAWPLTAGSTQSVQITSEIRNTTTYALDFPGGSDEIGERFNRMQDHLRRNADGTLVTADSEDGTAIIFYNFQTQLGRLNGNSTTLLNSITEQQKQRAREVISLYERYLGARFVETENLGLTIAVGDTRAVAPFPETARAGAGVITLNSVGAEYLESGFLPTGQLATVLDSQDFGNSTGTEFGGEFSRAVMQGIGNLLGLGGTDDLAGFTTQKFTSVFAPGVGTEIVLPGDADIVHGQYLYRPDSKDIDLYQFRVPTEGRISIEAFAQRLSSASVLDTQIRLYQQQTNGGWTEIAANDDYYSDDSYIELVLSAGNYIVGVSASGNNQYDPNISDSGLGGRSQGAYQLRMDFRPPAGAVLRDADSTGLGTALDGDGDGSPGGVFNYWFRPAGAANTKFVDKQALAGGTGSLAAPFKNIKDALAAAVPGDVVRIVGNGGADKKLNTVADNLAYEIGFDSVGRGLADGTTLDVPKNVSVFIDAGAVLKLRRARVSVGSTSASVDRSGGSLMVLGTPVLVDSSGAVLKDAAGVATPGSVYFTSLSDTTLGVGISPPINNTSPLPGDWGGLDFRNRVDGADESRSDFERNGQFVNWVSHADLRYGGGQVVVDGVSQVVTPIQMVDARPSVVFSQISKSLDAAMSATPNSFRESNFHTPDEQRSVAFSSDYDRVGPDLRGNTVTGNSINGLLILARTSGGTVESMTVSGRFDDTEIVHVVPENLQIAGSAGGFISDVGAPPTTIVSLSVQAGGTLPIGTYSYVLTYVDRSGNESPASNPTQSINVVAANSSVVLQNLPTVRTGSAFVARRLYRSDATGTGNYVLVRELNANSTTVVDDGSTIGSPLNPNAPSAAGVTLSTQFFGGTLPIGSFNYKITFVDASGNESSASLPTTTVQTFFTTTSTITLQNLPVAPTGFVARRLYRSEISGGGNYRLVQNLDATSTTFTDDGTTVGSILSVSGQFRARQHARLAIDPGTVVKLQGSRIEAQISAQIIAEGTPDRPVIFTSTSDLRYGAGGTFSTTSASSVAAEGNWGGIYVGPAANASIDHAVIAFGGGTTRIEGGFADFNAIETHQGDLRLTNSRLENNGAGNTTSTSPARGGRGSNDDTTIFIRGAQPIIVDNVIVNNSGSAMSTNVSALNSQIITDWGRSTGGLDRATDRVDNQGPLVLANRLDNNDINGLVVRGGDLTTEGVWDDTDIVHVVLDEIRVPNFSTYGGLRLQSSSQQSLVVKLSGNTAGVTATGAQLDNADRIGGSVRLVGQPGFPVIMTSLGDDTVGVGFTPDGVALTNTDNVAPGVRPLPTGPEVNRGLLIDNDVATNTPGSFSFSAAAGGSSNFGGGITAQGRTQLLTNLDVIFKYASYIDVGSDGRAVELRNTTITQPPTLVSPDLVVSTGTFAGSGGLVSWRVESRMDNGIAKVINKITLSSPQPLGNMRYISYLDEDVQGISDDILWTTGTPGLPDFRAYTLDGPERIGFSQGGVYQPTAGQLENATYGGWAADIFSSLDNAILGNGTTYTVPGNINLTTLPARNDPALGNINGPGDITTAFAWEVSPTANTATITTFLELIPVDPSTLGGDWRSVLIDQNSNDRNVDSVNESESPQARSPGSNDVTGAAEFLGDLATDLKNGDENRRLGFQVQGVISQPSDVDVYSFRATGGTEVWFDIDRTLNSLDTVIELVDANGRTLALSDNSLAEEANSALLMQSADMPSQSVHSLRKSAPELYLKSAAGAPKDLYSTNPRDAGMRVVLPGEPGTQTLYHVRIRSSNLRSGDPTSRLLDPALVTAGITRGAYQLQVRLREEDEVPGSSVTYADLRFGQSGIQIVGMPKHSPLLGEVAENGTPNETFNQAQPIGNVLANDKQALSIAGSLDTFTDVDWYSVNIDYTSIRPTGLAKYLSTIFDVDYAAGIGRPNMSIYIFDSTGRLIYGGLGSNVVDDQASGVAGASNNDLSRGSSGSLDPYIGSVELKAGQYFVAVTNRDMAPGVLTTFTNETVSGATAGIRMQPINGVQLIAEDHIGFTGGSTAGGPLTPVLFPTGGSAVTFDLSDVDLYVSQNVGQNATNIYMVNPHSGEVSNTVGRFGLRVEDIAFRFNGSLRAFDISPQFPNANVDQDGLMDYIDINPGTAAATDVGDLGIQTSHLDGTAAADSNDGMYPNAITFASIGGQERGFIVGSRGIAFPRPNVGSARPGVSYTRNVLYEFDENSGTATSAPASDKTDVAVAFGAGTAIVERGYIETSTLGAPVVGLVAREATRVDSNGNTISLINDGDSFTLLDSSNFTAIFEFDSGPEVLVNYNPASGQRITDGLKFSLDGVVYEFDTDQGVPGVSAGAIAIRFNELGSYRQLVDAIAASVASNITVTSEGNRLTFGGALIGDFTQLQNRGIFIDQGSSGNINPGAIKVPFLATDTANDVALRMVQAINGSSIPGLQATANGPVVTISGGTVTNSGPLNVDGAPGGTITGAAVINGTMFAVSDAGGLYRVFNPTSPGFGNVGTYVSTAFDLVGIQFAGLTAGPTHLQNGAFAQTLFGIDNQGVMYAFDTSGRLLPIFAGGATSVDTGLFGANGLSFSTLDFNLWHVSGQRSAEPGHGLPITPDASRGVAVTGGSSLYFGFESPGANGAAFSNVTDPGIRNSYDFPGGAAGAIESQVFDLSGLSEGDQPTLYFNYRFESENANAALPIAQSQTDYMRDALRVYVSGEDGQWSLAATNNSTRGIGNFDDEFDVLLTGNDFVQELFDNNGQWRQARIPLDAFAGQSNVKLRIEFASAGGFGFGAAGGEGPQLRLIAGNRLVDGQTITIGGRDFEIEMGPSLALPAGSSLSNGDSITIEGVNYVFSDGTGAPVVAPNVAVPFTTSQSAEQVAATLLGLIQSTPRPQVAINLAAGEQNDTIARALIGNTTGDSSIITVTGNIGDNLALSDPTADIDIVRVDLARGATVLANVNALTIGSPLDTYLRIFDGEGQELAFNDNRFGSTDSRINFVAPRDGIYYFAVSGSGNTAYNPAVFGTGAGASSGNYQLVLSVNRLLNPVQDGGRLQLEGARHVVVPVGSPILVQGGLGALAVPIYVNASMTANQVGLAIQESLATTLANGNTTAFTLRNDTLDLTGLVQYDSFDFLTGQRTPSLAQLDPGPFGATTNFVGDVFGAFNTSTDFSGNRSNAFPGALGAQANAFDGVYLDDFIIGIAGRGEMVQNAPVDTSFIRNPQFDLTLPLKPRADDLEVLVGAYQVEVRGGTEYGVPRLDGLPSTLFLDSARSPRERQAEGVAIQFNSASSFSAGTTFTIGDGTRTLTFELDNIDDTIGTQPGNVPVPFSNAALDPITNTLRSETANRIAARMRELINSAAVQSVLDLQAVLSNSDAVGESSDTLVLIGQANVNVPASVGQTIISTQRGDSNREREQGQVVIRSAKIRNSTGFGISIDGSGRDANGIPLAGTPRNLLTRNSDRLVTGVVVMNSELIGNVGGGISINGEPQTTGIPAPVPYARLVNNTIVGSINLISGGSVSVGTGIRVQNNASPTIVNNVIANTAIGLDIDASSTSTVVGGSVFHRNVTNTARSATLGQFPLVADDSKELFFNVTSGNLYPGAGSQVIDSGIDSLQDRPSIVAVKNSYGAGASAILAPQYDINGLLRVDDPGVTSPSGLGENVFKDRGAEDRADLVGPSAVLLVPVDNDFAGQDRNPAASVVELTNFSARSFDIQLFDGLEPSDPNRGSNINDSTVNSSSVLVYKDNVPLVDGIDYRFGYDATSNVIRLTPLAGLFPSGSVYQVRFVNTREFAVTTLAGRDYTDGALINLVDKNDVQTTFELDTGYRVSVPANGTLADVLDGGTFTLDDGVRKLTFEFDTNGQVTPSSLPIAILTTATPVDVARAIQSAINLAGMQFTVVEIGSGNLQIDGSVISSFSAETSRLTVVGKPGVRREFGLQIPLSAGRPINLVDGETFTINRSSLPVTFELDSNGVVTPGRVPVRFTSGSSATIIGQSLVTAIRNAGLGLLPTYVGDGLVALGGDASTVLGLSGTQLTQSGTAGLPAAKAIKISAASTVDETVIANQIAASINAAAIAGVTATPFGDRVVIAGAKDVSGSQTTLIRAITDFAGNALKPNQPDGQSTVTVFLGEGLDYGDAPDPAYASKRENNGPRHTVVQGLSLGREVRPDPDAKLVNADEFDDGVQFQSLVAAFQTDLKVFVTRPATSSAFLSAWIDYNSDGVFASTERIANALPIISLDPTVPTTISFVVSGAATVGQTYARFRLSSNAASVANPSGLAPDGEVEDHQVTIGANPFRNSANNFDVNGDGAVSAIDVLQIINYINNLANPTGLSLPRNPLPPFWDVNGDGSVTSIDALLVINFLNSLPAREGEGESDLGESVATASSEDWMDGIEQLAVANSLDPQAAPPVVSSDSMGVLKEDEPTIAADIFFAQEQGDDQLFLTATASARRGVNDLALDGSTLGVSEANVPVEDLAKDRVHWMFRQRLASSLRR